MGKTKRFGAFLGIVFLAIFLTIHAESAETKSTKEKGATDAPEEIILSVPEGTKATKTSVMFHHAKHSSVNCNTCHHSNLQKLDTKGCSTGGCHFDMNVKSGTNSFYATFHSSSDKYDRSCLDCHRALKKEGRSAGPTICKHCHSKSQ